MPKSAIHGADTQKAKIPASKATRMLAMEFLCLSHTHRPKERTAMDPPKITVCEYDRICTRVL